MRPKTIDRRRRWCICAAVAYGPYGPREEYGPIIDMLLNILIVTKLHSFRTNLLSSYLKSIDTCFEYRAKPPPYQR
jgi:hypothetical protein